MFGLSKRIVNIISLVSKDKKIIVDICCDHGLIGLGCKKKYHNLSVVFIDIVPWLVKKLNNKILELEDDSFKAICNKADEMNYSDFYEATFIIAGVGGELCLNIIKQIEKTLICKNSTIIVSPHSKVDDVREYLNKGNFSLIDEILVKDNNKFYQMIHFSFNESTNTVSQFGDNMWKNNQKHSVEFLCKELDFLNFKNNKASTDKLLKKINIYKNILKEIEDRNLLQV